MATTLLIIGESGTGKSTSLEHLPAEETIVFSPNGKSLPFQGSRKKYLEGENHFTTASLGTLVSLLKGLEVQRPKTKYIVIDDFTHYQNNRMMSDSFVANKGYDKWNQFGADIFSIIKEVTELLPSSIEGVIIINHSAWNDKRGVSTFKSAGVLLDNTIDIVSYFTYVFHSLIIPAEDGITNYRFLTNNDGQYLAKTPKGCFSEKYVDNDAMEIFKIIKAYENNENPIKTTEIAEN